MWAKWPSVCSVLRIIVPWVRFSYQWTFLIPVPMSGCDFSIFCSSYFSRRNHRVSTYLVSEILTSTSYFVCASGLSGKCFFNFTLWHMFERYAYLRSTFCSRNFVDSSTMKTWGNILFTLHLCQKFKLYMLE